MARWEYVPEGWTIAVPLDVHKSMPDPSTGAWGPTVIYNDEVPDEFVTLKFRGMTLTELNAEKTKARTKGNVVTYSFSRAGETLTFIGRIVNISPDPVDIGSGYWSGSIQLRLNT